MNFIEALVFYKHGNAIKRKGDEGTLIPSSFLLKKIQGKMMSDRDEEHLRLSHLGFTEGDLLADDWIVFNNSTNR